MSGRFVQAFDKLIGLNGGDREPDITPSSSDRVGVSSQRPPNAMPARMPGPSETPTKSKYHREIKPGVFVDVYDVLAAWKVENPALQHLVKKALQPGARGHKTRDQDLSDIVASAIRAKELG